MGLRLVRQPVVAKELFPGCKQLFTETQPLPSCPPKAEATGSNPVGCAKFHRVRSGHIGYGLYRVTLLARTGFGA